MREEFVILLLVKCCFQGTGIIEEEHSFKALHWSQYEANGKLTILEEKSSKTGVKRFKIYLSW